MNEQGLCRGKNQNEPFRDYSTVTDLARFLG